MLDPTYPQRVDGSADLLRKPESFGMQMGELAT
jgi:hypothetical protein